MEGLLDFVLRDVLTRVGGADRCVSEFIRITGTLLPDKVYLGIMPELRNGSKTLAGVPVRAHMLKLYVLVGVLAGIVAFIDLSRFGTASLAGHTQDALNAISAAVIGGVSLFDGRGRMSGAIIGVFIPAILANGFIVVRVDPFWQNVAVGLVLIAAVYTDQLRRGAGTRER